MAERIFKNVKQLIFVISNHEKTMCLCNVDTKMFRLPSFYDTLILYFATVPHFLKFVRPKTSFILAVCKGKWTVFPLQTTTDHQWRQESCLDWSSVAVCKGKLFIFLPTRSVPLLGWNSLQFFSFYSFTPCSLVFL